MPHLKPVGHQSTNWMVLLVLMVATAALTSLGTTSPRYIRQQAMYLPWRGSHLQAVGDQHQIPAHTLAAGTYCLKVPFLLIASEQDLTAT